MTKCSGTRGMNSSSLILSTESMGHSRFPNLVNLIRSSNLQCIGKTAGDHDREILPDQHQLIAEEPVAAIPDRYREAHSLNSASDLSRGSSVVPFGDTHSKEDIHE